MLRNAVLHNAPGSQPPIFRLLLFSLVALGLCLGPGVAAAQPGASLEALNRALDALSHEHAHSDRAPEVLGELLDVASGPSRGDLTQLRGFYGQRGRAEAFAGASEWIGPR